MYYNYKQKLILSHNSNMNLTDKEIKFIKETAHMLSDKEMANQLTRIRYELGVNDKVSSERIRQARYRLGLIKHNGTGYLRRNKDEKEE